MKKGNLVKFVHASGWNVPLFDTKLPVKTVGMASPGETYIVIRHDLKKYNVGPMSAGWSGDAEILHPTLGACVIEQAYLEVLDEAC